MFLSTSGWLYVIYIYIRIALNSGGLEQSPGPVRRRSLSLFWFLDLSGGLEIAAAKNNIGSRDILRMDIRFYKLPQQGLLRPVRVPVGLIGSLPPLRLGFPVISLGILFYFYYNVTIRNQ